MPKSRPWTPVQCSQTHGVPAVVALAGRCLPFCSLQFPGVLASAAKLRFRFRFALVKLSLARGVEIAIATIPILRPMDASPVRRVALWSLGDLAFASLRFLLDGEDGS